MAKVHFNSSLMKVLIIEDEAIAYRNLERMLQKSPFDIEIIGWKQSVEKAKKWLATSPSLDLIFLDIQLGDGLSFSIFEEQTIDCPIIFTTAFDNYALQAFEFNSIDYLLKPFSQQKLNAALTKLSKRISSNTLSQKQLLLLMQQIQDKPKFKDRFHVKKGSQLFVIKTTDIAWIYRDDYVFIMTKNKRKHLIDYSLDQLIDLLDPASFYRLNRQFIVHLDAIERIDTFFNYKLKISLQPAAPIDVFVAKDRAKAFKDWLG